MLTSCKRLVWDLLQQLHSRTNDSEDSPKGLVDLPSEASKRNDKWRSLQTRMVLCCRKTWTTVRDVLCNDSPEGHLPNELDEIDAIDTKDVLSYSFRAIHESR